MARSKTQKVSPTKPAEPTKAGAAFASIQTELAALDASELATINLDIPQSVSIALGALPGLSPHRAALVTHLPTFSVRLWDRLESYALAAWYAHLLALPAGSPGSPVKPLLEEAAKLRQDLLADAEALARRGLVDAAAVKEIRAGQGNIDTANDLVALSALFLAAWSNVENKTAATMEDAIRAGDLGARLLAALGVREHGLPAPAESADRRVRAYTLFVRAYDQVRRALTYLRWDEGDADRIAPSLYKGRGGRPSPDNEGDAPDAPEEPVAPVAPAAPVAPPTGDVTAPVGKKDED